MTNAPEMQCPECQLAFLDAAAVEQHTTSEHRETRQQAEQRGADQTMERQQDIAGRREQAGQPSDDATAEDVRANNPQMAAAQPREATQQGQQQQQRQVDN